MRFLLRDLWSGGEFDKKMQYVMNMRGDEDKLRERLDTLTENRHKAVLEKDKRLAELNALDIMDPAYEMKYEDKQKQVDVAYEKIVGLDKDIAEVKGDLSQRIEALATKKDAHKVFEQITEMWDDLSDAYKKELVQAWVKEIRLYEKQQSNGAWIRGIDLQIPVVLDGGKIVGDSFEFAPPEDGEDFQHKETIDETVVLMTRTGAEKG